MNLYRIVTDVRAGSHQQSVARGDFGIITLWVYAESQANALLRASHALADRRYASVGRLQSFVEELDNDPLPSISAEERAAERRVDPLIAGYDAMKQHALAQPDGLHEMWLSGTDQSLDLRQAV